MNLLVLGYVIYEKKALTNIATRLAKDNLPGLVSSLNSNAINKFEKKNKWKRGCDSRETF